MIGLRKKITVSSYALGRNGLRNESDLKTKGSTKGIRLEIWLLEREARQKGYRSVTYHE